MPLCSDPFRRSATTLWDLKTYTYRKSSSLPALPPLPVGGSVSLSSRSRPCSGPPTRSLSQPSSRAESDATEETRKVPGRVPRGRSHHKSSSKPLLPVSLFALSSLGPRGPSGRLRIAILDACHSVDTVHPGARICFAALAQTPWFHSKTLKELEVPLGIEYETSTRLVSEPPIRVRYIRADSVRDGCLEWLGCEGQPHLEYDVLVVPGGSSSDYARRLGLKGRDAIRSFVKHGGGYCGICAGACLALRGWTGDFLDLVNAEMQSSSLGGQDDAESTPDSVSSDTAADPDGVGVGRDPINIEVRFSKWGRRVLWDEGRLPRFEPEERDEGGVTMRYHNGPVMLIPELRPSSRVLGRMWPLPESTHDPIVASKLEGSVGILEGEYGDGRAVLLAPHCESTHDEHFGSEPGKPRLRRVLQRAVLLSAAGPKSQRWLEESCHILA